MGGVEFGACGARGHPNKAETGSQAPEGRSTFRGLLVFPRQGLLRWCACVHGGCLQTPKLLWVPKQVEMPDGKAPLLSAVEFSQPPVSGLQSCLSPGCCCCCIPASASSCDHLLPLLLSLRVPARSVSRTHCLPGSLPFSSLLAFAILLPVSLMGSHLCRFESPPV